jgi:hypothetical protein
MNEARRQTVLAICRVLEGIEKQLGTLAREEEDAFDNRSNISKETALGRNSEDAVRTLVDARDEINTQREGWKNFAAKLPEPQLIVRFDSLPGPRFNSACPGRSRTWYFTTSPCRWPT